MNDALRHNFPDQYERDYHVRVLPTKITSLEAHYQHWIKQHQNQYIEVCSWDDSKDLDDDEILVKAALGGDEGLDVLYFCVKKDQYDSKSEFGYVIQEDDTLLQLNQ